MIRVNIYYVCNKDKIYESVREYADFKALRNMLVMIDSAMHTISIGKMITYGVQFVSKIEEIPSECFKDLSRLEEVSFSYPEEVMFLRDSSFSNCSMIRSVQYLSNLKGIGYEAFKNSGITHMVIGSSVEEVGARAFFCCSDLESLDIEANISTIPPYLCANCINLKQVTLSDKLSKIPRGAFRNCKKLEKVVSYNEHLLVENMAFDFEHLPVIELCSNLKSIDIKEKVKHKCAHYISKNDS